MYKFLFDDGMFEHSEVRVRPDIKGKEDWKMVDILCPQCKTHLVTMRCRCEFRNEGFDFLPQSSENASETFIGVGRKCKLCEAKIPHGADFVQRYCGPLDCNDKECNPYATTDAKKCKHWQEYLAELKAEKAGS